MARRSRLPDPFANDPADEELINPDRLFDPAQTEAAPPWQAPAEWRHRRGELPEGPGPRGPRGRLDWGYAARALARGIPIDMVARDLGAPLKQIRRNLRRSNKFRRRLAAEEETVARECAMRLRGLRQAVTHDLMRAFINKDRRVLMHLAQAMALVGAGALPPGGAATAAASATRPWAAAAEPAAPMPAAPVATAGAPRRLSARRRAALRALRDEIRAELVANPAESPVFQ